MMSDGRVQDEERATVLEKEKDNVIDLGCGHFY